MRSVVICSVQMLLLRISGNARRINSRPPPDAAQPDDGVATSLGAMSCALGDAGVSSRILCSKVSSAALCLRTSPSDTASALRFASLYAVVQAAWHELTARRFPFTVSHRYGETSRRAPAP